MKWRLYRLLMRLAHKYDWHYAPVIGPLSPPRDDGCNYQRWCQWCGFRENFDPYWYEKTVVEMSRSVADRPVVESGEGELD